MRSPKSFAAIILCFGSIAFYTFSRPIDRSISWDVFGYYLYLPATFYQHDIALSDISWADSMRTKYDLSATLYQVHRLPQGNHVIQYTSGLAILFAPAFFTGHFLAGYLGYQQDGFSLPYQYSLCVWSLLVCLFGLIVLRRVLLHLFSDGISSVVLILIVLGTNYYITISRTPAMAHNYLFLLHSLLLWFTMRWHNTRSLRHSVGLAFSLGLASLVRPTELVAVIIPICWGEQNIRSVILKIKTIYKTQKKQLLLISAIMLLCAAPQLIYWKIISGHFIINSYANPGEGFDFLSPHTVDFLFSFRKGWFIYTPLMLVALFGLIKFKKIYPTYFLGFVIFIVVNLYIISSWSCWWYAHCFSQRAMIQSYPMMAILLGALLVGILQSTRWRVAGVALLTVLGLFNLFQTWQYDQSIIHGSRMTAAYYRHVFGATGRDGTGEDLLLIDRALDGTMHFTQQDKYSEITLFDLQRDTPISQTELQQVDSVLSRGVWLNADHRFSPELSIAWNNLTQQDHCWLEVDAEIFCPLDFKPDDLSIAIAARHKGGNYGYFALGVSTDDLQPGSWQHIHFYYLTPEIRKSNDRIVLHAWYRGESRVFIKNITVSKWEKK